MYNYSNLDFKEMDIMLMYIRDNKKFDIYNSQEICGLYLDEVQTYIAFFDKHFPGVFDKRGDYLVANENTTKFLKEGGMSAHAIEFGTPNFNGSNKEG